MRYREFPCQRRLTAQVDCFWASRDDSGSGCKRVVPDGCIDIIFSREETAQGDACQLRLVGPMTAPLLFSVHNPIEVAAVRFRPGGASALLGIPVRQLQDRQPQLEEVWGAAARRMREQLAESPSAGQRLELLQDFLLSRLNSVCRMDPALDALIRHLETDADPQPLEWMAKSYGFGPRRLRRAFDRWVGLSPKQFSRIMRFQRLLARVGTRHSGNWAERALECGYYDQPHMNRDFKQLAGVAPSSYFAA